MRAPRAGDRARTGDIQFGKLRLYQLSYTRKNFFVFYLLVEGGGFEPP